VDPSVLDEGIRDLGVTTATARFVTPNYFKTLGVRLAAGRAFSQSRFDERFPAELTAIASYGLAVDRFGGVQAALGRLLKVNGVEVMVIGVAPPGFAGAVQTGEPHVLWLPLSAWQTVERVDDRLFAVRSIGKLLSWRCHVIHSHLKQDVLPDQ
jgi:hypothetical protein